MVDLEPVLPSSVRTASMVGRAPRACNACLAFRTRALLMPPRAIAPSDDFVVCSRVWEYSCMDGRRLAQEGDRLTVDKLDLSTVRGLFWPNGRGEQYNQGDLT
ncbi:hypothetical protein D9M70_407010 [compost metagenome]